MNKKMVLTIENFGAINNARIELKKLILLQELMGVVNPHQANYCPVF